MFPSDLPPSLEFDPDCPVVHPREALRMTCLATGCSWPLFRSVIQTSRERFYCPTENEDALDSRVGLPGLPRAGWSPGFSRHPSSPEISSSQNDSDALPLAETASSGDPAGIGTNSPSPNHQEGFPRAETASSGNPVGIGTKSLLDWGKTFLPDHFLKAPSEMHQWMADQLDRMTTDRGSKLNVLGPRGGAKSTVATLAYPLREALLGREPYIWILSDTAHQAHAHLENLKAELVDNELIAHAYPRAAGRGPIWQAGRIVMRNGVTIEAFGTGQRIRGRRARANRPTLLVCDDLQNDRHMESVLQRGHARTWFQGTLLKAGTPQTNVVNLATA